MKPYIPEELPLKNLDYNPFIKLIGKANRALARYDGLLLSIPNPTILLSPLKDQEAVLSSKIEGTQATLEEVYKFEAGEKIIPENKKSDIQEIINYRNATNFAVEELKKIPLSLRMLRNIHSILLNSVRGQNKDRGNFRTIQNWIGKPGAMIENATYVPPPPDILMDKLSNLENYIHTEEDDSIIQLAIIHAQFEMIHPFIDGNGRIGRIIIPIFLYTKNVLSLPMLYISSFLEKNRELYYKNLLSISKYGKWENWIKFFLEAVFERSNENIEKAKKILELFERTQEKIYNSTHSPNIMKILNSLFNHPIFKSKDFISYTEINPKTSYRILKQLKENKIIYSDEKSRKQTYYFTDLLKIVK